MPGRLLRLLSLLQSRREWSGAELAARLGVTDRTVRRDVERLRELDYPVLAVTGTAGGYRLGAGTTLPPLVLDDEEAVAVALGLVAAAGGGVVGVAESSVRALAKLEQVLPARLRPRLVALADAAEVVPAPGVPRVDASVLGLLASCCRSAELVSFAYQGRAGEASVRRVEPHSLVTAQGRWYLVAFDPDRDGWRNFRVDRLVDVARTYRRFEPRELPDADAATFLARSFAAARYRFEATMTVELPAPEVREGVFWSLPGDVRELGPERCAVRLSGESLALVVRFVATIASLGAEFTLDGSPEVLARVHEVGRRLS
jgi:predicted DNA-binding transcriptional regulator YafY